MHDRTNPFGVAFTFGCFTEAPGAEPVGEATTRHSWFAGQAWRLALCRACGIHLGWQFEGDAPGFFGLILDRLTTCCSTAGEGA
ncbi:MAG: cereblon family protein [Deferrisomatales bacterium]|nr:cereblon family protein [Deferrisomatales bacterium]